MPNKWRAIVVGYPIIARLINGKTVTLEDPKITLIPDDQLFNEAAHIRERYGDESHELSENTKTKNGTQKG